MDPFIWLQGGYQVCMPSLLNLFFCFCFLFFPKVLYLTCNLALGNNCNLQVDNEELTLPYKLLEV